MGFLRTILIILLVYYVLKFLGRLFAPQILAYASKKTAAHFEKKFGDGTFAPPGTQKDGEVTIDKNTTHTKNNNAKDVGEYIEFEELE